MGLSPQATLSDPALERAVLGSCLVFPEILLALDVSSEDFVVGAHREIWSALCWLSAEGEPVDTVRLHSRLADVGKLEAVGGPDALLNLTDVLPQRSPPTDRLKRLTRLRAVHSASVRVQAACLHGALDEAVSELASAHGAALAGDAARRTQNLMELCEGLLEELREPASMRPLVHVGYEILERHLGSQEAGSTIGVLADTNVGKSSVILETLLRAAQRNVVVGYLSVEDQAKRVRGRLVSMLSGVSSRKILQRRLTAYDMDKLARGFGEIERLKTHFHVSCLQGGSEVDVCAAMSELAARGCRMVAVDYVQKISSSRQYASRAHECANVAARITSHAQRLETVLLLASQCNRDKNRRNQCPSKHDMKESGDLENMLDYVVALWRTHEDDFAPTWVRIVKGKDGGVGQSWCLQRNTATGRLEEVEDSDRQQPPDAQGEWSHRGRAS